MNLQKTQGIVENLQVVRTKQIILYGPQMREAAGVSAVVFALAGMAGAAVQTSMNSDGGADDVDTYAFEIEGTTYAGVTRGISVKNGDEVELVYEARPQGNEVLAVRRPATRSIWLYPYMSRGSCSATVYGLRLWLICGLAGGSLTLLIGIGHLTRKSFLLAVAMSFLVVAVGVGWMLPRFFRFSRAADEVFAAFGYEKPKWVDLQKTTKAYLKANKIPWSTWAIENTFELWY